MSFDKNMKFDVRMLEYNLAQGIITQEEYDKYLKSLPDLKDNTVSVDLEDTKQDATTH